MQGEKKRGFRAEVWVTPKCRGWEAKDRLCKGAREGVDIEVERNRDSETLATGEERVSTV